MRSQEGGRMDGRTYIRTDGAEEDNIRLPPVAYKNLLLDFKRLKTKDQKYEILMNE